MSTHPTAGAPAANQYGVFKVHYATPAQVGYVASLLAGRDLTGDLTADERSTVESAQDGVATGKLNKKHASAAIDLLLALPELPAAKVVRPAGPPASDKQVALVKKLIAEKDVSATLFNAPAWVDGIEIDGKLVHPADHMTKREASEIIDALFKCPRKAAKGTLARVDAGMYTDGTRILRAYLGQQSGQILCKEVVGSVEDGYELEYRGLAVRHITADFRRMTLDEAKVWGKATGHCVKCGRRLDVPESVDAGIGPKCAGKDWN